MKLPQFQRLLAEKKVDLAFLLYDDPNVQYFLGAEFTGGFLLVTAKKATLLISPLDHFNKKNGITVEPLRKEWEKKHGAKTVRTLGINKAHLAVDLFERLTKYFPKAKIYDLGEDLQQLRLEKTTEELHNIKEACSLTSAAFQSLCQELTKRTLKTEQDVALFLESFIRKKGGTIAFPTIVAMGKNAAIPHHNTSTTPLSRGFLLLDFGARVNSYCADMSRVVFLGKPTVAEEEMYFLLLAAQEQAIAAVKENVALSQLDKIARQKLGKYASTFNHALGHGIGIEVHEAPVFSKDKTVVQRNVPFTIEPGVYFPGKYGLRIEDTLVWDGKKVEILTKAPKGLIVVSQF